MSQAVYNASPPPETRPALQLVDQIQRLVQRNSFRWKMLTVAEGLGLAVSALLAYLWLAFWLDNVLHLPLYGRALASFGLLVVILTLALNLVRRWRLLRLTEDQVALAIERRTPGGIQNRLINALQIARSSKTGDTDLSLAVIEENVTRIKEMELEQAAALRPALLRLSFAALLIAGGVACYYFQPERFANAATRILLPFRDVEPLYRTTLTVEPGDVEATGDVDLSITIRGERPEQLALLVDVNGKRRTESIPLRPGAESVKYTLKAPRQTLHYAVRGNDYTTRFYQITVPAPSHLSRFVGLYHFPHYTGLPDKKIESATGDLEALRGTKIDLDYLLDQPCEEATLLLERPTKADESSAVSAIERIPLRKVGPNQFAGTLVLDYQVAYQMETRQAGRSPHTSKPYSIRVIADQEPQLQLTGLEGKSDAAVDAAMGLQISATDDLGLHQVGIFYRRHSVEKGADKTANTKDNEGDWHPVKTWEAAGQLKFDQSFDLTLLELGAVEGETLDVVARATDRDPGKAGHWTDGVVYHLKIGGEAAALQLLYEQILRTEEELKQITAAQNRMLGLSSEWMRKFDSEPKGHWDDAKNVRAFHATVAEQSRQQTETRERSSRAARAMVEQAGNLRLSVGMLADTEMVRAVRIFESIPTRDQIQAKRAAIADLQLTEQRTLTSLQQILEQYTQFRQEWELNHMVGFVKMLADRQAILRDASLTNAMQTDDKLNALRQASTARRQEKILALTKLSEVAFIGMSERMEDLGSPLASPFSTASASLAKEDLANAMRQAIVKVKESAWAQAATHQAVAAEQLLAIHAALRKAQIEAARQALSALEEKAKSDVEAQRALEKLKAGDDKSHLELPEKLTITDIVHMQELAAGKKKDSSKDEVLANDYLFPESQKGALQQPDSGKRQEFDILKLGNTLGKTPSFPAQSDREANTVKPHIQEDFEDLVGKLLEEADEMQEKYETYNLNAAFNINEPGEVGKQGGDLNSTAASAATGNKKPPTSNVGGASRSGRRGARGAHGMLVGEESINRRGRDKVQEGQERVADQAGTIKETNSDDPQKDTSTGVGGKKVESDDTKFSVADAGKWTDDMAQRMGKPQNKNNIVERQDGRMDPRVAEMLRDLTSDHEQIIERVKSIRKELKNLYLPTDHLDEILAELNGQLDRLKERPTAELFRLEQQTMEKLRGTLRVFHQAHAGFQPSVPRQQVVRGHVLDEASRPAPPGYEQAVKRYYEKLSTGAKP